MDGNDLVDVIGEAATIALAEEFAGTRLYVPAQVDGRHRITFAIGQKAADALCAQYGPAPIRVPLLRELRAEYHRMKGLSHAQIAVRLGLTEKGVAKLFKRLRERD